MTAADSSLNSGSHNTIKCTAWPERHLLALSPLPPRRARFSSPSREWGEGVAAETFFEKQPRTKYASYPDDLYCKVRRPSGSADGMFAAGPTDGPDEHYDTILSKRFAT